MYGTQEAAGVQSPCLLRHRRLTGFCEDSRTAQQHCGKNGPERVVVSLVDSESNVAPLAVCPVGKGADGCKRQSRVGLGVPGAGGEAVADGACNEQISPWRPSGGSCNPG